VIDKKELEKLYEDCIEFWGFEKQAREAQEECAELIVSISHYLRGRNGASEKIIEELADVYLMLNQLIPYFGKDAVMDIVDLKSDRVRGKLEKYKAREFDKINTGEYEAGVYCVTCGAGYSIPHKKGCKFYYE